MQASDKELRAAWLDWMSLLDLEYSVGGTITFKRAREGRPISALEASKALQMFKRILDRRAYGNRTKRDPSCRLMFVAVHEGGREEGQKHPHVHFVCERPQDRSREFWANEVSQALKKIQCFGSDHCEVKPTIDDGWIDYMFKSSTKACYADAVDVPSLWTKSQST